MIEPVKFSVYVDEENLEIFTELLTKKRVNYKVLEMVGEQRQVDIILYPRKYFDKDLILKLCDEEEKTYKEVAEIVGCSKSYAEKVWQAAHY